MSFLWIFCLFLVTESKGQTNLYYGGKFGTTISQFTNQQPHTNINQGITAGGFIGYNINDKMAVQLELSFMQEGGQLLRVENPDDLNYSTWYNLKVENQDVTLNNLDIPVLFKYSYPLSSVKIYANLGAAMGYTIHAGTQYETTVYTETGSFHTYTSEENITSKIEKINFGIVAGLGFEIPVFTKNYILIDARYRYGLMPVYKGHSYVGLPQVTGDLNNNTMYITLGFGF
jgi:hypothetical protein